LQHAALVYVVSKQALPAAFRSVEQQRLQHGRRVIVHGAADTCAGGGADLHGYSALKHAASRSQVCLVVGEAAHAHTRIRTRVHKHTRLYGLFAALAAKEGTRPSRSTSARQQGRQVHGSCVGGACVLGVVSVSACICACAGVKLAPKLTCAVVEVADIAIGRHLAHAVVCPCAWVGDSGRRLPSIRPCNLIFVVPNGRARLRASIHAWRRRYVGACAHPSLYLVCPRA